MHEADKKIAAYVLEQVKDGRADYAHSAVAKVGE